MAHAILRPTVIKFLEMAFADDATDIQIEEILVNPGSKLIGVSLIDSGIRRDMDLIIIAIQNKEHHMIFNPKAETTLQKGDIVVAMGCAKSLKQLEFALQG